MRRYGVWKTPEDSDYCVVSVHEGGRSVTFRQCGRKRGRGPEGEYCWQHARAWQDGEDLYVPKEATHE